VHILVSLSNNRSSALQPAGESQQLGTTGVNWPDNFTWRKAIALPQHVCAVDFPGSIHTCMISELTKQGRGDISDELVGTCEQNWKWYGDYDRVGTSNIDASQAARGWSWYWNAPMSPQEPYYSAWVVAS